MKPALSKAARILSPSGPYMVLRKWSMSRNRNGSDGIIDSGTMPWKVAVLTRTMSIAPILTCSTVSFSEPSELSPKTLILSLPPVAAESRSLMNLTARLVGKSLAWTSADRKSRALAATLQRASTAPAMVPSRRMERVMKVSSLKGGI